MPSSDAAPAGDPRALQPLEDYEPPVMPTDEALQQALGRLRTFFRRSTDAPFVASEQLGHATPAVLDAAAAPPAYGPAFADLAHALEAWKAEAAEGAIRVVVLPPCETDGLLNVYARKHGYATLAPPPRGTLVKNPQAYEPPALKGSEFLVLPQLERWFLRHRNGLHAVRSILSVLQESERTCVVGCTSWAWAFLSKAIDADLLLPGAQTLQPFDAERLRAWLEQLARADTSFALRRSDSGEDVFAEGEERADFFRQLAARSRGIPWVAWALWRRSLFRDREAALEEKEKAEGDVDAPSGGERTLWLGTPDALGLPGKHARATLFVLHALLVHGALTPSEMRAVVPSVGEPNLVPALRAAGFVERVEDGGVRCRAAAYPAIRSGLADAGFPLGVL